MRRTIILILSVSILLTACLPSQTTNKGSQTITVYGFSIMREALEKEIYPVVKTPNLVPLGWRVSPLIHISTISGAFPNPI